MRDNSARRSDPDLNTQFSRDWSAGRFHARLAGEAAAWLKARRDRTVKATLARCKSGRLRAWRAGT